MPNLRGVKWIYYIIVNVWGVFLLFVFIAPFISNMQPKVPRRQKENIAEEHIEVKTTHKVIIRVKKEDERYIK